MVLPRDDGPHDRLTEWWYYTGHLRDATGDRFGFEFVVFRAERGALPDVLGVAPRASPTRPATGSCTTSGSEVGPQVDRWRRRGGRRATLGRRLRPRAAGVDVAAPIADGAPRLDDGRLRRHRQAGRPAFAPDEAAVAGSPAGLGLDLRLRPTKPAALHDRDGWIDFGPAGGSYYYSRTAMDAAGTLTLDGRELAVDGTRVVRPPVGRLHLGRWRRLGLVRGQPRGRDAT